MYSELSAYSASRNSVSAIERRRAGVTFPPSTVLHPRCTNCMACCRASSREIGSACSVVEIMATSVSNSSSLFMSFEPLIGCEDSIFSSKQQNYWPFFAFWH